MTAQSEIAANLQHVHERIAAACKRAGRSTEEVTLLAVSKTKPMEDVLEAAAAGQRCFGENYVQELTAKYEEAAQKCEETAGPLSWHMIGHLQRNKVKYIIGKVDLIHSVDTLPLAQQIEKEAVKHDLAVNVLLEVNVAAEESKWGFDMETAAAAAKTILEELPHVCVNGLMTSAPYTQDPETNRLYFRELRGLAERLAQEGLLTEAAGNGRVRLAVPVLSMGMSGDYEVAVEEGATIVRIGSSIFGARDYSQVQK